MSSARKDVIGGINAFLDEQSKDEKPVNITLVQFDDKYQVDYKNINVKLADRLNTKTYVPRGSTALYDAIGRSVNDLGAQLSKMNEEDRPQRVVVVIYTDGEENASREYTLEQVKSMITHQQDVYNWQILFLGAGLDKEVGLSMGIRSSFSVSVKDGACNIKAASRAVTAYSSGKTSTLCYSVPESKNDATV